MSGFSPQWLALREPVDHRSRDIGLARAVAGRLAAKPDPAIVDLGCGTGSNLRASYRNFGARQNWTLVDYDPRLLEAARTRLEGWAERAQQTSDGLVLDKNGKRMTVRFREADLVRDLDFALGDKPDLVTASALFDLCSAEFIARFAGAVAARKAMFYTVLTYDGVQTWTPEHAADADMREAFHAHQHTDKGFGASAGPSAPRHLKSAFENLDYKVQEADTPWRLGANDASLIADLAKGFAGAVAETGRVDAKTIADWSSLVRSGSVVGHTDTLAVP